MPSDGKKRHIKTKFRLLDVQSRQIAVQITICCLVIKSIAVVWSSYHKTNWPVTHYICDNIIP